MRRAWTQEEIDQVTYLYCYTNKSAAEIGQIIGRTQGSVSSKIGTLGLKDERYLPPFKQTHGQQT